MVESNNRPRTSSESTNTTTNTNTKGTSDETIWKRKREGTFCLGDLFISVLSLVDVLKEPLTGHRLQLAEQSVESDSEQRVSGS